MSQTPYGGRGRVGTTPYGGWGHHTSLFQWRRPAFWVFVSVLAVTGLLAVAEQGFFLARAPAGLVLSWVLLGAYLLPMAVAVYRLDLYEREPVSLVLGALVWGGVAATTFAGLANQGWGITLLNVAGPAFASTWSAALTAPLVEEIVKGAGVVLLYQIASHEFDDVLDGFVYGGIAGLGFAVVEDVFYFVVVFGGSVPGVIAGFFLRVLAGGLYGHVLYTGLVGMGVAHFVTSGASRARRTAAAAGLFGLAVVAHFFWNSPLLDLLPREPDSLAEFLRIPLALAIKGMPLLFVVAAFVSLELTRQRRVFASLVEPEIGGPALTLDDARALETLRSRRAVRRRARRDGGRPARRLARRLHHEQTTLALLRARLGDGEEVARQREKCVALKRRLDELCGRLSAQSPASWDNR